jgi:HSP20 family protein
MKMFGKNLLPTPWRHSDVPEARGERHDFNAVQKEMNRLFDDFFRGFDLSPFGETSFEKFSPRIDIRENEKELAVQAELPGLDEKDVEILIRDDSLTIKGEKKEAKEDKGKDYYYMERSFGAFNRVIPLPPGIDQNKVEARFKNGVLHVMLPKTAEAKAKGKKITIKSE